jgi:hypothetical protein
MPMTGLEYAATHVARLTRAFLRIDLSSRIARVQLEQAIQSLREIFFLPSEVRAALVDISQGKNISLDLARYFADYFREIDGGMEVTLNYLDPRRFSQNLHLRADDIRFLDDVRNGKVRIRSEISSFFDEYFLKGPKPRSRQKAAALVRRIDNLNKSISTAEKRLDSARKKK